MKPEDIKPQHLSGPPTKIGKMGAKDLYQLRTKGGLYMLVTKAEKGFNIISMGPHRQVARIIAEKNHDDIEYTELSKADHLDPAAFEFVIPEYEELTKKMQVLNGDTE